MFERILVPVDVGPPGAAFQVAEALAGRVGGRVVAVVVERPGAADGRREADAAASAAAAGCQVDDVEVRPARDVASGILAASATPGSLLCLTTYAGGAEGAQVVHAVSDQVLRRTTRPVLAVGPRVVTDPRPTFSEVVACVDDLVLARHVAPSLATWATGLGAEPRLVQVVDPTAELGESPGSGGAAGVSGSGESAEAAAARRLADELHARGIGATLHLVRDRDPADAILRFAEPLRGPVVVIASHSRSRLRRAALGTVARRVTGRSSHPVLVVPTGPFLGIE
ncbi:MAG TPA: universal stress protein [Acidimicrobiales bacterium]